MEIMDFQWEKVIKFIFDPVFYFFIFILFVSIKNILYQKSEYAWMSEMSKEQQKRVIIKYGLVQNDNDNIIPS